MFNVTGGELVIILLVALIVLGPDKLPDAIRKVGRVYGELRRMSQGFQSEIRDALDEPMREVRDTMNTMKSGFSDLGTDNPADPPAGTRMTGTNGDAAAPDGASAAAEPPPPPPETTTAVADPPVVPGVASAPDTSMPWMAAADSAAPVAPAGPEPVVVAAEHSPAAAEPVDPANGTAASHEEPALTIEELAASPAEPSPPPAHGVTVAHAEPAVPAQTEHP